MRNGLASITLFASFLSSLAADTLVYAQYFATGGGQVEFRNVWQFHDRVLIEIFPKYPQGIVTTGTEYRWGTVEADVPSLLAQITTVPPPISAERLYRGTRKVADFDFSRGDGWVDTYPVGWVYMRAYPWIYSLDMDWLYVQENAIWTSYEPMADSPEPPGYAWALPWMSYDLYSPTLGWLWKNPHWDVYYHYASSQYFWPGYPPESLGD